MAAHTDVTSSADQTARAARPFDNLGKKHEDAYGHLPEQLAAIDWLLARLPDGARVLDVGSGTGRPTAERLAAGGHRVTGCDVSETMVRLARAQVPAARFERVDIREPAGIRELADGLGPWDAVTAFFSLSRMTRADIEATLARIGQWLVPGGLFVFATAPSDAFATAPSDAFATAPPDAFATAPPDAFATAPPDAEEAEVPWTGQATQAATGHPAATYPRLLRDAGLEVIHVHERTSASDVDAPKHLFLYAVKPGGPDVPAHALTGPYPQPEAYRGRHELTGTGWSAMEARFQRHDIAPVVDALTGNERVLDVGGGSGAVVRAIAGRLGACVTVEPDAARAATLQSLRGHGVTVLPGRAEGLPVADGAFDAAVATWVLHYTDDPDAAVAEMARVVDPTHPEAKVVLVQGAPDNELIALWNRNCAALTGEPPDHQGHLLTRAARVLARRGFRDVSFTRARIDVLFPEEGAEAKARAAAEVLSGFWDTGHPRLAGLRQALLPALREHFAEGGDRFTDDGVILVARPRGMG
ncbi:methyltransferase domain-containing protein [Streptomyces sp. NPDC003077]|uniref:methyltransferase domain-containing protein n=1 Tax=Streptomyces sp. NPDC003077 TaxID=3154443 RepID=UPI0033B5B07A